jgi:hypothetical protein
LNNIGTYVRPSWWARGTLEASKVVEFHTTFRAISMKWYMKSIEPQAGGQIPTLADIKRIFIEEFQLPQPE